MLQVYRFVVLAVWKYLICWGGTILVMDAGINWMYGSGMGVEVVRI